MRQLGTIAAALLWAVVAAAAPMPPTALAAHVNNSTATVSLAWLTPPGTTAIRLEAGTGPGLSNAANSVLGAISSYAAAGVPAGTYYVRVRAIDATGESAPSNEVIVVVGTPSCASAPAAPVLQPAVVVGNSVSFFWASAGCQATNAALHAGSGAGLSNLAIVNGVASGFSANGPNGRYFVRVVASNPFGSAVSNEIQFLLGPQPWSVSGSGANVFTMPGSVRVVTVTGAYGGFCENFVVWVGTRLLVNEILGTCSVASGTTFTGTYATTGGQVRVEQSTGMSWTFTQVQ